MRQAKHLRETRNAYKSLIRNTEGNRAHLGQLGVNERIIIKLMLKKQSMGVWTGVNRLSTAYGPTTNFCEHGYKTSDSIKVGNFLTNRVIIDFKKGLCHRLKL
jgi:hypothetical protein